MKGKAMGFILEGPEEIEMGRILAVRSALGLEIKTGMKMSRGVSVLKLANDITGSTARNKVKAYEALNAFIVDRLGESFSKPLA
jgi:hypothetical protein